MWVPPVLQAAAWGTAVGLHRLWQERSRLFYPRCLLDGRVALDSWTWASCPGPAPELLVQ